MTLERLEVTPPLAALGQVAVDHFLAEYWQREPCVLRAVFPQFEPELDEHDIAGLACEEQAESRLVSGSFPAQDWTVRHGPFAADTLSALPPRDWTLLVQDVEKHYPPLRGILARFAFLPTWRLDDLMVSVSAPGGSVGPHVDRYDVFLVQASGRRRWEISRRFDPEPLPDCELNVLRRFSADSAWDLEPGDVLYLPPGIAHHGVALDTGMTWSIGLRAPSQADLFLGLGEWLAENQDEGERFTDGPGMSASHPGEIDAVARGRLRGLLAPPPGCDRFLGEFLTAYRLGRTPEPPAHPISREELARRLQAGAILRRDPWTRLAWTNHEQGALLFAAGQTFSSSPEIAEMLCAGDAWRGDGGPPAPDLIALLCQLVNAGHLYLE
jgi:50S ribosomal protein L16 3-hydroxylase